MIFGDFALADAEHVILAHGLSLPQGALAKGRVIRRRDLAALAAAGITAVSGARLEAGDLGEDDAANAVAAALAGPHLTHRLARNGRADLLATARGLAVIDRPRLEALNLIDEGVTVATVPPGTIVSPGQPVASVKVIPLAIGRGVVDACVEFAAMGEPAAAVAPFVSHAVAMILTFLPGAREAALDTLGAAARTRVEALGGRWTEEARCRHDVGDVEHAILGIVSRGCSLLLIAGASSTVDRRDVVPLAIERVGGRLERFGIPANPGNLLVLAHVGAMPVVGVPGCVRSSKPNGFDLVLPRLMANLPVGRREIAAMAVGGLLEDWAAGGAEAPARLAALAG